MTSEDSFKPNWLAIFAIVIGLITVGWLAGLLASSPDGLTVDCPEEDMIQIVRVDDHVVAYCESY